MPLRQTYKINTIDKKCINKCSIYPITGRYEVENFDNSQYSASSD